MEHVNVFIRIKPTNNFDSVFIELLHDNQSINIHDEKKKEKRTEYINNQILAWNFRTDGILQNISQEDVYNKCAAHLVEKSLDGYNSTLFAYGQSGAGKTYTMTGTTNSFQHRGIIPRVIGDLYKNIQERHEYDITIRISYLEIYCEEMYDLLGTLSSNTKKELSVNEDEFGGTYVKGLACHHAQNEEEALSLLFEGETNRVVSHYQLNRNSSRSHCIFTIYVESHSRTHSKYTTSKFHLVDLAGSERLGKTLSKGLRETEAMYINKSLTFLEQTIIALGNKNRIHVPYRQSKLTHVLKDALGGKCDTVMIGNIWSEETQKEETLSTLRFASRVMQVSSKPAINSFDNPFRLCKELEKEITTLRRELAMYDTLTNRYQINYEPLSDNQIKDIRLDIQKYVDGEITELEVINLRQVNEIFTQFKFLIKNLEKNLERKVNDKLMSQERTEDPEKGQENITTTSLEKSGLVGETDGNGFHVGKTGPNVKSAQPSSVVSARKKNKKTKDASDTDRRIFPPSSSLVTNSIPDYNASSPSHINVTQEQIFVPPHRDEAFETFKLTEHGRSINAVYLENKSIWREKRLEAKSLSVSVNKSKQEIDDIKVKLELIQNSKEIDEATCNGQTVLDENEFKMICQLKTLKNSYRLNFEHLQNIRTDLVYCEKLVFQCRQRLLTEFQIWYRDGFGITEPILSTPSEENDKIITIQVKEDDGEKFDRIQRNALMKHPESVSFYSARVQVDRRKLLHTTSVKKRLGSVTTSIRNAPPKTMIMH